MSDMEPESSIDAERLDVLARRVGHDPALMADLYRMSEAFREICDHYAMCRDMLKRFRQLGQVDGSRVEEYADMRDGLEQELRAALDEAARKNKNWREEG